MAKDRTFGKAGATIVAATGLSGLVNIGSESITCIIPPAVWTAAVLEFETTLDGVTWVPVVDDAGAAVSIASAVIAASKAIVDAGILRKLNGLVALRLCSGPAGGRVPQAADRVFTLITKTV